MTSIICFEKKSSLFVILLSLLLKSFFRLIISVVIGEWTEGLVFGEWTEELVFGTSQGSEGMVCTCLVSAVKRRSSGK